MFTDPVTQHIYICCEYGRDKDELDDLLRQNTDAPTRDAKTPAALAPAVTSEYVDIADASA